MATDRRSCLRGILESFKRMKEKEIRAVYTKDTIRVYQAYNAPIAKEAVEKGTFGSLFKMERM